MMDPRTRRTFLKTAGAVAVGGIIGPQSARSMFPVPAERSSIPFTIGIASYTFRAFSVDKVIDMTTRLRVRRLTLKDMHLPMTLSVPELTSTVEKIRSAGIELASVGVVYMKTEDDIHKAFAYATAIGVPMMTAAPAIELLPVVEREVKSSGISVAIHNHGPDNPLYPSPESAYERIASLDKRIGLCIDIGHTQRLGLDPSREAERFADRLIDVHLKDVDASNAKGSTVEIGRGVIDIPKFLKTMIRLRYSGTLHLEHEKDQDDPLPGLAESLGYVHGVLATL